jgi:protein TonB
VFSVTLHAFLLFGIAVRMPKSSSAAPPSSLEVVLVNAKSEKSPDHPTALAQYNMEGGGNTDADRRAQSPLPVAPKPQPANDIAMQARRIEQLQEKAKNLLARIREAPTAVSPPAQPQDEAQPTPLPSAAQIMNKSLEIARLEGQISKDWDDYQKRPRRQFIGVTTQEYRFARYVEDWRLKIERIGTINYPEAAREQKIYGSLRMTVSLRADGSVEKIEINHSSGYKILDDAAIRIVNLAAPYAPFPADISRDTDILSITRTWTFTNSDQLSTQ